MRAKNFVVNRGISCVNRGISCVNRGVSCFIRCILSCFIRCNPVFQSWSSRRVVKGLNQVNTLIRNVANLDTHGLYKDIYHVYTRMFYLKPSIKNN